MKEERMTDHEILWWSTFERLQLKISLLNMLDLQPWGRCDMSILYL